MGKRFGPGTREREVAPGIVSCSMAPDYKDCLSRAMAGWEEHRKTLPERVEIGGTVHAPRESVYGFAYWLIR